MLLRRRDFGRYALAGSLAAAVGGAARAAEADKILVGILPLAAHAPTFIVACKDYFAKQGPSRSSPMLPMR